MISLILKILTLLLASGLFYYGSGHLENLAVQRENLYTVTANWPSTLGLLTQCEKGLNSKGKNSLLINFNFQLEGKFYSGTHIDPAGGLNGIQFSDGQVLDQEALFKKFLLPFKAKKFIEVFYNPANPTQSFLLKKTIPDRSLSLFAPLVKLISFAFLGAIPFSIWTHLKVKPIKGDASS